MPLCIDSLQPSTNSDKLSGASSTCRAAGPDRSIGKIQPLFTRAHSPAPPHTSPVSPLGALPSRPRPPVAGESAGDRQPGRTPAAPRATQSGEGTGRGQGEKTGANVWDGGNPLAHAEVLRRGAEQPGRVTGSSTSS